jgi:hypothetical protein
MAELYPIVEVRPEDVEDAEQMGTKAKFWFRRGRERWLFKEPRGNTGEHWAEKVAAEIGLRLGVSCARVELADYQGKRGSASLSFADRSEGKLLIHGNEMLAAIVSGYDKDKMHKQCEHTWDHILTVFAHLKSLKHLDRSAEIDMAGYVVLDALIGNVDRHHQNWGCLLQMLPEGKSRLTIAPSFDHASSLGRELLPEEAARRVAEKRVANYVEKGRGGIYRASADKRGANPLALACELASDRPDLFAPWLERLIQLPMESLAECVERLPESWAALSNRRFAVEFLRHSSTKLTSSQP